MKIKDIGRVVTGKTPATGNAQYYNGKYMFIAPTDIAKGFVLTSSERTITEEGYLSISSNTLHGTSVLVGCIGSDMGNVAIVEESCATNQQINAITDIKCHVNPYYVYYYLSMRKSYLRTLAGVTTTPILPKSTFEEIDIVLPPKLIQDKVVNILYVLDDKIRQNARICTELEAMAKTLYDYWFTQFDFPNAEGKPYRSSGGEMIWNDQLKREIPKGWDVGGLCDLGAITSGGTPSTDNSAYYAENGIAWITPNDLSGNENLLYFSHGERDITEEGLKNSSAMLMPPGTVLFSSRAPIGYIAIAENEVCSNQGFKSIVPNKAYGTYFVYYTVKRNTPAIAQQGVGTTFKEVSRDTMERFQIVLPPIEVAERFEKLLETSFEERRVLEHENRELTKLRDWLLPMLMNGQIVVVDRP